MAVRRGNSNWPKSGAVGRLDAADAGIARARALARPRRHRGPPSPLPTARGYARCRCTRRWSDRHRHEARSTAIFPAGRHSYEPDGRRRWPAAMLTTSGHWQRATSRPPGRPAAAVQGTPWLAAALAGRPTLGPNRLRALEGVLDLLKDTGLSLGERLVLVDTLAPRARLRRLRDRRHHRHRQIDLSSSQWQADQGNLRRRHRQTGQYPLATCSSKNSAPPAPAAGQELCRRPRDRPRRHRAPPAGLGDLTAVTPDPPRQR